MIAEAEQRGLPVEINAYGVAEFAEQVGHYQVVLLGPQVKYMQQDLQKQADKYGIRVEPINMMDYGMQKAPQSLISPFPHRKQELRKDHELSVR